MNTKKKVFGDLLVGAHGQVSVKRIFIKERKERGGVGRRGRGNEEKGRPPHYR